MTGTAGQIEWAEEIKARVNAEFDRVAKALESAGEKQGDRERMDTRAMIAILEDKRAEVMAREQAGYFIVEWQEMRDQVRQLIAQDSGYQTIKARKVKTLDKEHANSYINGSIRSQRTDLARVGS